MSDITSPSVGYKRPRMATVLGIIGLVYSILMLSSAVSSVVTIPLMQVMFGGLSDLTSSYGAASSMYGGYSRVMGEMLPYLIIRAAVSAVVNGIGLIGSIGLLKNKPWSRTLLFCFAALCFVEMAASVTVTNFMINPLMQYMENIFSGPGMGDGGFGAGFMPFYSGFMKGALILGAIESVIFPVILIILLNKQKMKDHFQVLKGRNA